jgi:hypothetical protein
VPDRAVSDVLGYVIIFALALTAVTAVSFAGVGSVQSAQEFQRVENAERAFDIVASNLGDIHRGNAPSRATEITIADATLRYGDTTRVNVTATDGTKTTSQVYDVRPLVYETDDDRRVVYEAGATFRERGVNSVVVRNPPFLLTEDRVMIPVVATTANRQSRQASSGTVSVRATSNGANVSLAETGGTYDEVSLTVTSPRAGAWKQYMEDAGLENRETGTAGGEEYATCQLSLSAESEVYVSVEQVELELER